MKGKGNVDTYCINMYGSQRNIKKSNYASDLKGLNSAKSNQSLMSYKGGINKDHSLLSKKSNNAAAIDQSNKQIMKNIIGKGLLGHLKVKLKNQQGAPSLENQANWQAEQGSFLQVSPRRDIDPTEIPLHTLLLGQSSKMLTSGLAAKDEVKSPTIQPAKYQDNIVPHSESFEEFKSNSSHSVSQEADDIQPGEYNNSNSMGINSARHRQSILKVEEKDINNYQVDLTKSSKTMRSITTQKMNESTYRERSSGVKLETPCTCSPNKNLSCRSTT